MSDWFLRPEALWLAVVAVAAWLALRFDDHRRTLQMAEALGRRQATLLADRSGTAHAVRRALYCAGILLACLALAGPTMGERRARVEERGIDIVVCLDVSRSMLAADVSPTRLERARAEIRALSARTRGDRLALVAFAGDAQLIVPRTRDVASFDEMLANTDPLAVTRGGTDLGRALSVAAESIEPDVETTPAAILLVTDGEDHGQRGLRAAEALSQRGVPVFTVGVGTAIGSKIATDGSGFVTTAAGDDVVTRLDSTSLEAIAATTAEASYLDVATSRPGALGGLYDDSLRQLAQKAVGVHERDLRANRYQWLLGAALIVWLIELLLSERRRR